MTKKYFLCLKEKSRDGQRAGGGGLHSPLVLPISAKCHNLWQLDTPAPQVQLDRTHTLVAYMGQGAPKDMLVTFVIGADDGHCHKTPIVTKIVENKTQEGSALQ